MKNILIGRCPPEGGWGRFPLRTEHEEKDPSLPYPPVQATKPFAAFDHSEGLFFLLFFSMERSGHGRRVRPITQIHSYSTVAGGLLVMS